MLLDKYPLGKCIGGVGILDGHGRLENDRTGVELGCHDVDCRPGYLYPVIPGLSLTV